MLFGRHAFELGAAALGVIEELRADVPRRDCVDRDPGLGDFEGQGAHERMHPGLRCSVDRVEGGAELGRDRSHMNDAAPASCHHGAEHRPGYKPRAEQIGLDDGARARGVGEHDGRDVARPRTVDEDFEAGVGCEHLRHHAFDGRGVGHVQGPPLGHPAGVADRLRCGLDLRRGPRRQDHAVTVGREPLGDPVPDAPAAPDDERHPGH